ncbi:tubulin epsilon and delta complex protein 1-like [Mya arenaria]|uniref:tubulin epsilon and delta complex protein 1-like n=1 Tax=Mya arenaria TaxID=6604 RepID=UPI0022E6B14E|nr:tubulin epsilon and delta complex protein 1-like [Mya arenaria]
MAAIRETVCLLANVLESIGCTKPKAEIFRLAKFNSSDVVIPFWQVLYELHSMYTVGRVNTSFQDLVQKHQPVKVAQYIKKCYQDLGYLFPDFTSLQDDMSEGSRELLLVLAWFLSSHRVVDCCLENTTSPLDTGLRQSGKRQIPDRSNSHDNLTLGQRIQRLNVVSGRLHLTLKHLHALHRQKYRLIHRVHTCTEGVGFVPGRSHMSVVETDLMRHPQHLKTMLGLLEKENSMLSLVVSWKEHEHVFWKWMESVLALKLEENSSKDADPEIPLVHYNLNPGLVLKLFTLRQGLEARILRLEPAIARLDELWEDKQRSLNMADLQSLAKQVNAELDHIKSTIGLKEPHSSDLPRQDPVFLYSKPQPKKTNSVYIPELHTGEDIGGRQPQDIGLEIEKLQTDIARLKLDIEVKERYYRQKLDDYAARVPESVCIQPATVT